MMADDLSVLLPYQRRWLADRAQVKVWEKSRRIGATWTEALDRALSAATAGRAGMDGWYIGYNKDMALEFVEAASLWARRLNRAAATIEECAIEDEHRDILAYRIRFASGHKVVALSSRPSNLRGKEGCAVIDEAAFHDDLAGLLKAALAFVMWGGCVRVLSTHNGADNPFNELVTDIRAGRRRYALHRTTFDDALAEGLYKRICTELVREWSADAESAWRAEIVEYYGDGADEELFCTPRARGGAFLASALIESRMREGAPVLRLELADEFAQRAEEVRQSAVREWCEAHLDAALASMNPMCASFFGEDFGRSGDLTVIWPLQIEMDVRRTTPFVVELRNVPFRQQEQVLFYIVDRLPRFIAGAMDARGNGQYLEETAAQRYGAARIAQVMLTQEWYRENMPRYRAAFEDGTIEIPRDADILMDHRAIVIERGIAHVAEARTRGSDRRLRHGDSAIAAVLAYFASRLDGGAVAYEPVARQRRSMFAALDGERGEEMRYVESRARFGPGAW
ncbi:MAG: hypothetical protein ACREQF_02970 [Candidatus Binataceae bacterium]